MNLNYKTFRRTVFSFYVFLTVLFCLFIVYMGKKEITRAREYAENEKNYTAGILASRKALNSIEATFIETLSSKTSTSIHNLSEKTHDFTTEIKHLSVFEKKRGKHSTFSLPLLKKNCTLMSSVAAALRKDINAHSAEKEFLLAQDIKNFSAALKKAGASLQTMMRTELDNVEIWKKQSFYFFKRLQYLLILFFVLTTMFTVAASFSLSYILKSALRHLSEGTRELSSGRLEYRFRQISGDEIGKVMHDFNTMASKLQQQSAALTEANSELKKNAEELLEAHQHRDRFMANVSHELRTPLNSIIGFSELLMERAARLNAEKIKRYGKRMLNSAEHLLELISDILLTAKIDAGALKPVFTEFNLSACVRETASMMEPAAERKKITFKAETENDEMPVTADKRLIKQVLINLLGNAVKFTEKGNVSISLTSEANGFYRVDVTDTGIGISPENIAIIFKDFHRVENGLTSNYEGVGIGLTLSKRLAELHGGKITVSSKQGRGSVFSLRLPADGKKKRNF